MAVALPQQFDFYKQSMQRVDAERNQKARAGSFAVNYSKIGCCSTPNPQIPSIDAKLAELQKQGLVAQIVNSASGRDKVTKTLTAGFAVVNYALTTADIDPATKSGMESFGKALKDARTIFAIWNIFTGVMDGIWESLKTLKNMISLCYQGSESVGPEYTVEGIDISDKPYFNEAQGTLLVGKPFQIIVNNRVIQVGKDDRICFDLDKITTIDRGISAKNITTGENSIYRGRTEQVIGIISQLGHVLAAIAYAIGFGLCSPIKCLEAHFKGMFGEATRKMGDMFGGWMAGNHIVALAASIADLIHTGMTYANSKAGDEGAVRKFFEHLAKICIFILKTAFEIVADVFTVFKASGPPIVRVVAQFLAASVDLWRAVRDANIKNDNELIKFAAEQHANILPAR